MPSGKTVFKKPVKLTLTVMPTQTTPSLGELSEASIIFDGKTFTVTFSQTAGELEREREREREGEREMLCVAGHWTAS